MSMAELLSGALRAQYPFPRGDGIHYAAALRGIRARTGVQLSKSTLFRAANGLRTPDEPTLYVLAAALDLPFDRLRPAPAENSDLPP